MTDRLAVGVTHHVISEYHATHPGQHGTWGLQEIASSFWGFFRAAVEFIFDVFLAVLLQSIKEPSFVPMTMCEEDTRLLAALALGTVEIAAHVMAGSAGEEDLFDGIFVAID